MEGFAALASVRRRVSVRNRAVKPEGTEDRQQLNPLLSRLQADSGDRIPDHSR
jgi:hypothetical protein